jgi:hypothetical protein
VVRQDGSIVAVSPTECEAVARSEVFIGSVRKAARSQERFDLQGR